MVYYEGEGISKDVVEAARWYRMAAEQGDANVQFRLGLMYFLGIGVYKDNIQAYAWVNVGVAQIGDEDKRKILETISEDMTASSISKAQILSREYWETYGPKRNSSE